MIEIKQKYNDSQYHVIGIVNNQLCIIVIDIGACVSHISSDLVKEIYEAEQEVKYKDFLGLKHIQNKASEIEIIFSQELSIKFEILVDFQEKTKEVLLGIDFQENFEFIIRNEEVILKRDHKQFRIARIRLNQNLIRKQVE